MGKKKIQKQTDQDLLKERERLEEAQKKAFQKSVKDKGGTISIGQAYIRASYNNTFVTITDETGRVLVWSSAGSLGFTGPKKATPYAASKVVEAVSEKLKKINLAKLNVFVKGIGRGREAAIRALATRGFNILSIKDVTPIPHDGCRPPKPRRV